MVPYSGTLAICPKCGQKYPYHASTKWISSEKQWSNKENAYEDAPECMLRTCMRCGYSWHERPLDQAQGEEL